MVEKMDAILDATLDVNMVLVRMQIWCELGCHLRRKSRHSLGSKIRCYLGSKPRSWLGSEVGCYFGSKSIDGILDIIKDAI